MLRTLTFEVPLPHKELSPNLARKTHWTAKNGAVNEYKATVAVLCREAMGAHPAAFARARISLAFGLLDKRPVAVRRADLRYHPEDFDNAVGSCKALIDGIVVAGLIPDDSWKYLECGAVVPVFDDGPWVRVTIEELE